MSPNGVRYTRDGSFKRDANGYLVTGEGYRVQGSNGDIYLPEGDITFDSHGGIYVGGQYVDSVRVLEFPDKTVLRKEGDNLFVSQGQGNTVLNPIIKSGFWRHPMLIL